MDIVIPSTTSIKFLGLLLDNKLMWKAYSRELAIRLNKACYAVRAIKSLVSLKALISMCFSYFHSLLMYGIIFWGNSPVSDGIKFRREQSELLLIKASVNPVNIFLED